MIQTAGVKLFMQHFAQMRIAQLAAGIVAIAFSVYLFASSDTFGTLVRNSLVFESASSYVDWSPNDVPSDFRQETSSPPSLLREAAKNALAGLDDSSGDLIKALSIARFIGSNPRLGKPIRSNTVETYNRVVFAGRGYCADYSQLFLALALASDIAVREWGFGIQAFGSGHAFNEVYVDELSKWVFIDSFQAFYVEDPETNVPMSVTEFQAKLRTFPSSENIRVVPIDPSQFSFPSHAAAIDYYKNGADFMYLYMANDVFSYDEDPVIAFAAKFSRSVEIIAAILRQHQPAIRVVPTEENKSAVIQLRAIQAALLLLGFVTLGLAVRLLWLLTHARHRNA